MTAEIPGVSAAEFASGQARRLAAPDVIADAGNILQTAVDPFVATDIDGTITAWNLAAETLFGYRRSEAVGSALVSLIIPEDLRDAYQGPWVSGAARTFTGREREVIELSVQDRLGRTFPVEVTHWGVHTADTFTHFAFIRDISARKEREIELTRRRAREAELTHRAMHDQLTGVANRALLLERLGHALVRRQRYGGTLAVLFVDLDRFKLINDSLGHEAGDELLIVTAHRLLSAVRASDSVARISGDEFVVLLDSLANRTEAITIAERILAELRQSVDLAGERVRVRGSIGVAFADDDTEDLSEDPAALLRDADAAMYRAKETGRDRVMVFDSSMRQRLRNELRMSRELAECLERDQMRVWYRPLVSARAGRVAAMQPCIYWDHPRLGELGPVEFSIAAETVGMMPKVLQWGAAQMIQQAQQWRSSGHSTLGLEIDLTARHLSYPLFIRGLLDALAAAGLPGEAVTVSVMPPSGMEPEKETELLEAMQQLREHDVRVAINACGMESAALTWLAHLPFEGLKIAPQLGVRLGLNDRADAVVRGLITIAHELDMPATVDGLATTEQRDAALNLGADFLAGPIVGDFVPVEEARLT